MAYEPSPALARRAADSVAWLTTVTPKGRPAPRPVWFVLDGDDFIVFSAADAAKVRHIEANPEVSIHFNSDEGGGDVLVIGGRATLLDAAAKPSNTPGYLEKYESHYPGVGYDVPGFDAAYGTGIRITPERSWGF